jgi:hypothetical protein
MTTKAPIFEETTKNYLAQLAGIDFLSRAKTLGITIQDGEALIPCLETTYRVSPNGVFDPLGKEPLHAVSIVLCRYLLLCPEKEPLGEEWVSYKDFKNAGPFVGGFVNNTEKALVRYFSGRMEDLKPAGHKLGGHPSDLELSYEVVLQFDVLPKIPLLLLFNDKDEEFPAQCSLLFQKKAERYLDMECLAILGWFLTDALIQALEADHKTMM